MVGPETSQQRLRQAVLAGATTEVWAALESQLLQRALSRATLELYRVGVDYYLQFLAEQPFVPERLDFEREFRRWLLRLERRDSLSPRTVRQYVMGARQLQRVLHQGGEPFHYERFASEGVGSLPFTSCEIERILVHADFKLRLVILLMCEMGLRPIEVRRVTPQDIDLGRATLILRSPVREIGISPFLTPFLAAYLRDVSLQISLATEANVIWERQLKRACIRAGVDCAGRSLHSLRVYAAARMLIQGAPYREVQYRLGLASRTNKRRYEVAAQRLIAAGERSERPHWDISAQDCTWSEITKAKFGTLWQGRDPALLEILLDRAGGSPAYRRNTLIGWRQFLEWYWEQSAEYPNLPAVASYRLNLLEKVPLLSVTTVKTRISQARRFVKLIRETGLVE